LAGLPYQLIDTPSAVASQCTLPHAGDVVLWVSQAQDQLQQEQLRNAAGLRGARWIGCTRDLDRQQLAMLANATLQQQLDMGVRRALPLHPAQQHLVARMLQATSCSAVRELLQGYHRGVPGLLDE
jgi:hypothetical protein